MPDVTFTDSTGKVSTVSYPEKIRYPAPIERERFAQLLALGTLNQGEAYAQAWGKPHETVAEKEYNVHQGSKIAHETGVVLRVQELRKPLVRKLQRKFEYSLDRAGEQCQTAYDLAYEQGDARAMLKATELLGKFSKLLSEQIDVNHRYGLLDDASTETLLAMRKEFEVRETKQKKLKEIEATNVETVGRDPRSPSFKVE